jgi:molybdopterin molybdotransferase
VYFGIAPDSAEGIAAYLAEALECCDAAVTTGGVSVGDYDLTPDAMALVGAELLFRGVDLKPGMACAYGIRDGKPIFALSGNPASCLTNFYMLALPALRAMRGCADPIPAELTLTLAEAFPKPSWGTRILRGRLDLRDGTARFCLSGEQGNAVLSSAIGCDALAIVPAGSGPLEAGTKLKGFLL